MQRAGLGLRSVQELIIHLANSDAIAIDLMKWVIAKDNPTLIRADEQLYVERLYSEA